MTQAAVIQPKNRPADLDAHQADKAAREKAREKRRAIQLECLDAAVAAQYEASKPLYEWKVEIDYMQSKASGGFQRASLADQVVAKTETDAWALFCDKHEITCGPKACLKRVITRLGKRKLNGDES